MDHIVKPYRMIDRNAIRRYIDNTMPLQEVWQLLTMCSDLHPDDAFCMREFNLGFQRHDGADGYSRFHQFDSLEAFKRELLRRAPARIDVGAILSTETDYMPLGITWRQVEAYEKEPVIDIDVDDYADVRSCNCSGKMLCAQCWHFLATAASIVNYLMEEKFGCNRIMWIYSGRRGVHGWILDQSAAHYPESFRHAIADYLSTFQVNRDHRVFSGTCKVALSSYESIVLPQFEELVRREVVLMRNTKIMTYITKIALGTETKNMTLLRALMSSAKPEMNNMSLWNHYKLVLQQHHPAAQQVIRTIVFSLVFPRIDRNVTTAMKHLIKCPYSWHPRTGAICVPFDVYSAHEFDPTCAPNLHDPSSLSDFWKWSRPIQLLLRENSELARRMVCIECCDLQQPLSKLPLYIVFNDPEEWEEHQRTHDHTMAYTADNSRLHNLVVLMCGNKTGSERQALKRIFYDQLSERLL